jgi:hypothetical protein
MLGHRLSLPEVRSKGETMLNCRPQKHLAKKVAQAIGDWNSISIMHLGFGRRLARIKLRYHETTKRKR